MDKPAMDPLGALFAGAWRRYKERFWTLVWIFLVPSALLLLGQLILAGGRNPTNAAAGGIFSLAGGLLAFAGSIISVVASLALINALAHGTDFATSYRVGLKLFWSGIWLAILVMVAVAGGFILLIVPGIILAIGFMFTNYALVVEDKRGMQALLRSRQYVRGYWWAVLGRGLLAGAIFVAGMLLIYLPSFLILGAVGGAVVYLVLIVCYSAFSVCYTYEMYENLRRIKAGNPAGAEEGAEEKEKKLILTGQWVAVVTIFIFVAIVAWGLLHL